jgi:hypothetical protein
MVVYDLASDIFGLLPVGRSVFEGNNCTMVEDLKDFIFGHRMKFLGHDMP